MNSNPMDIAGIILKKIEKTQIIDKWDIVKPGFINVHLSTFQRGKILSDIIKLKDKYGTNNLGQKEKVLIEFVSVNPTGPVHVGHARGAVLGSAIANILKFSDFKVSKEYYVNDAGNQIDLFIELKFYQTRNNYSFMSGMFKKEVMRHVKIVGLHLQFQNPWTKVTRFETPTFYL